MQVDWIIKNVNLATMQDRGGTPYGKIEDGLLAVHNKKIAWLGKRSDSPVFKNTTVIDGDNGWLTPGLIDCHTHLIYGGDRAEEFEKRLQGKSYEEIAHEGGGINSTVTSTRNASNEELLASALHRLKQLHAEGVTTVEIKSGYGLDLVTEVRMLKIARDLQNQLPVTVKTTFLGAHTLPPEFNDKDDYIDFICQQVMPEIHKQNLADAVDLFCENIGFTSAQSKKVFEAAKQLGLPVKGHVEQLTYSGGARLIAEFNGLSADHLEYLADDEAAILKQNNVVAVLLPAAFYYLHEKKIPPINALRKANVEMAVATDCNPGSAPMASLLLAMNQACVLFELTPEEALFGTTNCAAKALGLGEHKGQLQTGYDADILLWNIHHPAELSYGINMNKPQRIWVGGSDVGGDDVSTS